MYIKYCIFLFKISGLYQTSGCQYLGKLFRENSFERNSRRGWQRKDAFFALILENDVFIYTSLNILFYFGTYFSLTFFFFYQRILMYRMPPSTTERLSVLIYTCITGYTLCAASIHHRTDHFIIPFYITLPQCGLNHITL